MVITRFAPSPTGNLHIGGLRTALYCYLYARKNNGKFLLRIEDTDKERNSEDALNSILESFRWVGLEYDEPMLFQSKRVDIYKGYIQELLDCKKAYYCYLSKEELYENKNNRAGNQVAFTRKYRDAKTSDIIDSSKNPSVIRIKAPLDGKIEFSDGIKGVVSVDAKEIDDFVIARSDGSPTYNFVVAIDDALSCASDIIRGDDHLSNTPKQILVYEALGFKIPRFYHVPMICNEMGKKLSKRDGVVGVMEYKDRGILKEALLNFLFRLGFSDGDKEIFSMQEMLDCFNPLKINSKASSCNFSKLEWLNVEHMRLKSDIELIGLLENKNLNMVLDDAIKQDNNIDSKNSTHIVITSEKLRVLFKELLQRVKNLVDFNTEINNVLLKPEGYEESMLQSFGPHSSNVLKDILSELKIHALEDVDSIKALLNDFAKSKNIKIGALMPHLRLALLGKKGGIDIAACIYLLGIKEVENRIDALMLYFKKNIEKY